jgi:hypothetical protein
MRVRLCLFARSLAFLVCWPKVAGSDAQQDVLLSCERARHWALTEASQNLAGLAGLKSRAGPAAGRSAKANPRSVERLSSVLQASRLHDSVNVSVRVLSVSEGETMSRQGKLRYLALRVSDDPKSTKHDQLSLRESSSGLSVSAARALILPSPASPR